MQNETNLVRRVPGFPDRDDLSVRSIVVGEDVGDEGDELGEEEVADVLGDVLGRRGRKRRMLAPGVQRPGERRQWVPFPAAVFAAAAPLATRVTVSSNVQRPFRGFRLIAAFSRIGAAAPTGVVALANFSIANVPQPAATGLTPIDAFAAAAFDLSVDLDSSQPGVLYELVWELTAAAAALEVVSVTSALFGHSLR